jgi:hypothetical protein
LPIGTEFGGVLRGSGLIGCYEGDGVPLVELAQQFIGSQPITLKRWLWKAWCNKQHPHASNSSTTAQA